MKRIFFFSIGLCALFLSVSFGYGQPGGIGVYDVDGILIENNLFVQNGINLNVP